MTHERTELDFSQIRTLAIRERGSKVHASEFAALPEPDCSFSDFIGSLPDILAAADLAQVVDAIVAARTRGRPVLFALGAHVVKCGLGPVINDLLRRGIITGIAMNGACAIHDYEILISGGTSEDVEAGLAVGDFGMARETADAFSDCAAQAVRGQIGLGRSLALASGRMESDYAHQSILATCGRSDIPLTVHIAIGTDIVHMHPCTNGAHLGEASYRDFRVLAKLLTELDGGVWVNVGSAVILPEVFLKGLSVVRNLGHKVEDFVSVNLDFQRPYRSLMNVVSRPTRRGYNLIGHHEIMLPLIRMAIISRSQ